MALISWKDWKTAPNSRVTRSETRDVSNPRHLHKSAAKSSAAAKNKLEIVEAVKIPKLTNPYQSVTPPPEVEEIKAVDIDIEVAEEVKSIEIDIEGVSEITLPVVVSETSKELESPQVEEVRQSTLNVGSAIPQVDFVATPQKNSIFPEKDFQISKLNENATLENFCKLRGVGPKTAEKLLKHCPFESLSTVRDLVSPAIFEQFECWLEHLCDPLVYN